MQQQANIPKNETEDMEINDTTDSVHPIIILKNTNIKQHNGYMKIRERLQVYLHKSYKKTQT